MTKANVVVVDDDLAVRRGLSRLLRAAGYDVEAFESGRTFIERGDFGRVACLVLDVRMPGQSGFDVQRVLVGAGYDIPIVFITGHGDASMVPQAMNAGAVDFLIKPFDDDVLLDAVQRGVLRGRQVPLPQANGSSSSDSQTKVR